MNRYEETLYDAYTQVFSVEDVYYESKSEHQHIIIFHNSKFGRVMALDGIIQTTERDEFIYHEMLTHVPIIGHGAVDRVLIIGGGDGGMLREACRHSSISRITMVEIDRAVVDLCREYLPTHSRGAFDDPRLNLVISDGAEFVATTDERFDVIIVDSTDPIGPGEALFTEKFYSDCKRCLYEGGVIVTQNGVAFFQIEEAKNTADAFRNLFRDWHFYTAAVPTYVGGVMAFGWGTDNTELRHQPLATLEQRYQSAGLTTRYYNPSIHQGSFALPQYLANAIGKPG
ncbi:MAG: polyamine aminopropyltransferase [Gammaproteobacteria bacterium]